MVGAFVNSGNVHDQLQQISATANSEPIFAAACEELQKRGVPSADIAVVVRQTLFAGGFQQRRTEKSVNADGTADPLTRPPS